MIAVSKPDYDLDGKKVGTAVIDGGKSSGSELAWKFFGLGKLTGKTAAEIIAAVGLPTSDRAVTNGHALLEWEAPGYHVALLFNAEKRVVKIAAEFAQLARRL